MNYGNYPCYILNQELGLTKDAIFSLGEVNLITIDNDSSMGGGIYGL